PVKGLTDVELMAHLFRRAGFGATRDEIEAALTKGYEATVEELLHPERQPDVEYDLIYRFYPDMKEARRIETNQAYWLYRMVNGKYGQKLIELCAMGIGNYSEDDVKICARAFTGWCFEHMVKNGPHGRIDWTFKFHPELHDFGEKEFLGEKGNFDGEDIIGI